MPKANRRALLVGINDYPGASSDLPSCLADVDAMSTYLQNEHDFTITTLRDGDATLAAVSSALAALCADVGPDDRICFFYSGHGTTTTRRDSIEECLFLADGGLLPGDDFVATMAKVPHGTALVILDACFSGGMQKEKGTDVLVPAMRKALSTAATYRPFGRAPQRPSWKRRTKDEASDQTLNAVLLAACQERETAMASTPQTMDLSAFSYALLGTMATQTFPISIDEVMKRATEELRRIGVQQTPALGLPNLPRGLEHATFPQLSVADTSVASPTTRETSNVSSSLSDLAAISARAALAALPSAN